MCFDLQPISSNIKQTLIILFSPEFECLAFHKLMRFPSLFLAPG